MTGKFVVYNIFSEQIARSTTVAFISCHFIVFKEFYFSMCISTVINLLINNQYQ